MNSSRYCENQELIENYEKALKDNFKGWHCHHRLETHTSDGERRLVDISKKELIALDMYYNRPAEELIFLTKSEHIRLHKKGNTFSEETKKRMSEAKKNMSEETKNRMSEAKKGKHLSEEHKKKIAEEMKGHSVSEETKKRIAEANKGMRFFNNGKISIRAKECPEGFVLGRLKNKDN